MALIPNVLNSKHMRYAQATPTAISSQSLIVGWAVPTNAVCKLYYLSGALPTLDELKNSSMGENSLLLEFYRVCS
ncbi:hypothetical protein [Moorena bouillonii]|uniref:Uncharacterized protein n=1 Tax=Moorena bouillonii PNG TaxID=568701 RepID=A0A1U7MZ67_9CYAN|nr:hypothetical protein [Moorena bouillonii]OLT58982.1 hypothetical protein BJP37_07935 [Moorena bouillonii PNG]